MRATLLVVFALLGTALHGAENDPRASRYARNRDVSLLSQPSPTLLVDTWYYGDHLGVNIELKLNEDDQFTASWTGCLGRYGAAHGSWAVNGGRLVLSPIEREGMFETFGFQFDVVSVKGQLVLVESDILSVNQFVDRPSEYTCYQRVKDLESSVFGPSIFTPKTQPEGIESPAQDGTGLEPQPPN